MYLIHGQIFKSWYRWVSYWKFTRNAGYLTIETLFYRNSCQQDKVSFTIFYLLHGGLHFLFWVFEFLVSSFWGQELLVARRIVVDTFWRSNNFPSKNKNSPVLYQTRACFLCVLFCRILFYTGLTYIDI